MKNLFLSILVTVTAFNVSLASSDPIDALKVISNSKVEFTLFDVAQLNTFEDAVYLPLSNVLRFESKKRIEYIQVLDGNGKLKMQLPVRSNVLRISKSLFQKGYHQLGFKIAGEENILFTNLTIN